MTGGGFGGCTVTMVRRERAARFGEEISAAYQDRFQVTPKVIECRPSAGAGEVTDFSTIPG
jgi:galactokinase